MRPSVGSSSRMILGSSIIGPGDGQHLLLAARQRAARLAGAARRSTGKLGVDLVQELGPPGLADTPARSRPGAEVLQHGQEAEDPAVLRHPRDPEPGELVRRQPGDRPAPSKLTRPRDGRTRPIDGLERRALADAVAAEEAHDLPGLHLERHAVQDVATCRSSAWTSSRRAASGLEVDLLTRAFAWISAGVPSARISP